MADVSFYDSEPGRDCPGCGRTFFRKRYATGHETRTVFAKRTFCSNLCARRARPRKSLADRFWLYVERGPVEECWPWTGSRNAKGYGKLMGPTPNVPVRAPRVSWELHNGSIPDGLMVLHECDNPSCVNPKHLFLGTASDNTVDMMAKARDGNRKLSRGQAAEIRSAWEGGNISKRALGRKFGVSATTISRLLQGKTFAWVRSALK